MRLVADEGFGSIEPEDGTDDVFFVRSSLEGRDRSEDLREGSEMQVQVRRGEKGLRAFALRLR